LLIKLSIGVLMLLLFIYKTSTVAYRKYIVYLRVVNFSIERTFSGLTGIITVI